MALGILEPKHTKSVPGTVDVLDQEWKRDPTPKRDKSGTIILVPQPSEDPNDPLNWPLWQRDTILLILCLVSSIATTASPLVAANSAILSILFKRTFQDAALLTAYHLCGVGCASILCVPFARPRRFGVALVNDCVGNLYFVHGRGLRMAFTNVFLFGGAFLAPVFVGIMSDNPVLGWQWSFYLIAIFMGAGFVLLFLFFPETAYARPHYLCIDLNVGPPSFPDPPPPVAKRSYLSRLAIFGGRKTDVSYWKLLLRPFPLFLHPAVAWGCLMQGVIIGWTVIVGVIMAIIFLGPPLFFSEVETGKMYAAAFIGSIIGLVLSGLYTELVTKFMVVRNGGCYEPEFRILLVLPTLVFSAAGLYGVGIAAANVEKYGWLIPEMFLALITISMVMGTTASAQYLLDAHRPIAIETFTCLIIFKNIFSFILTYYAYAWVLQGGFEKMFVAFGSIEVGLCCLSLPMYVFGKRNRALFQRWDILQAAGLR